MLGLLVACVAVLGGVGLTYLWSLGSPVYYGIKIEWGVLPLPLRTGVAAVFVLVLAAAVYPVIHSRRLETVEVLRSSCSHCEASLAVDLIGAIAECRRPHAEIGAGVPESRGLTWPRTLLGGNDI